MDAEKLINSAVRRRQSILDSAEVVLDYFRGREGELFPRGKVVEDVSELNGLEDSFVNRLLGEIVGDIADPIIQVSHDGSKYVGIASYVEGSSWFGYLNYDDIIGKQRRVVCSQCIREERDASEVFRAEEHAGSYEEAGFNDLKEAVLEHQNRDHDGVSTGIRWGASLLSGTTIGGNEAWHAGNDGDGSGLDADKLDGQEATDIPNDRSSVEQSFRFGAEGANTTSTSFTTIQDSDIAIDFSEYQDNSGNLEINVIAHLMNETGGETTSVRLFRQNAATSVSSTQVSYTPSSGGNWGFAETGWFDFSGESGLESYQLQLKVSSGTGHYNSVILQLRT